MPAPFLGLAPAVVRALMTRLIPMLRSGAQGLGRVPANLKRASDVKLARIEAGGISTADVVESGVIATGATVATVGARPHLQAEAKRNAAERALKEKNEGQIAKQILMQDQISAR